MDNSNQHRLTTPFCYLIGWSTVDIWYYGVRFARNAHPSQLWTTYFSSSQLVKKFRQTLGEPDVVQVRKVFDPVQYTTVDLAQQAAVNYESKVIRRMNMVTSSRWLNCSVNILCRTGERETNYKKMRLLKNGGQYHSQDGMARIKEFLKTFVKANNPMSKASVQKKHANSIAQKIGYDSHETYVDALRDAFEQHQTIKATSIATGHAQCTIRQLLIKEFGKEYVDSIRKIGLEAAKNKSIRSNKLRPARNQKGQHNGNAYVWQAIGPNGEYEIIMGDRHNWCKSHGIGTSLDPSKSHLRGKWEFKKLCKVTDYKSVSYGTS